MNERSNAQSPIACDMSVLSPAQRQAHLENSRELFANVQAIRELPDGYEFQLADDPNAVVKVAEFVTLEKLCCPFLNFVINVEAEGGPVTLRLTGREGLRILCAKRSAGFWGT